MIRNLLSTRRLSLLFAIVSLALAPSCRSVDDDGEGFSESSSYASHSPDAPADYSVVLGIDKVHRIDITIGAEDFAAMQHDVNIAVAQKLAPMWFEATVHQGDFIWDHVGIRYRGRSSIEKSWDKNSKKFPFKLTFDRFEDEHPATKNQRFYGFKKLSFGSSAGDDTLLREVLSSEALYEAGVVTAKTAFYRIYVDGGEGPVYWGLYTALEDPDDEPLKESQLGGKGGNLYKPSGKPGADWTKFVQEAFEKENHKQEADFSDVKAAIKALHDSELDADVWRSGLEEHLNVDSFLRSLAFSTMVVNWDSYGCKARNYYLYAAPSDSGRFQWLPTDLDESFTGSVISCGSTDGDAPEDTVADIFHENLEEDMPLIQLLLADSVYRKRYVDFLDDALDDYLKEKPFRHRAEELHSLIEPYVIGKDGEEGRYSNLSSEAAFEESLEGEDGLLTHMKMRRELVREAIESER